MGGDYCDRISAVSSIYKVEEHCSSREGPLAMSIQHIEIFKKAIFIQMMISVNLHLLNLFHPKFHPRNQSPMIFSSDRNTIRSQNHQRRRLETEQSTS